MEEEVEISEGQEVLDDYKEACNQEGSWKISKTFETAYRRLPQV